MYREYTALDLPKIDEEILQFWNTHDIFRKSIETRPEDRRFVFYEGPPSANGMPGIHHVMARTIKDLICRFQTMKGKRVERKGGWDTHGLPVELTVEKELGITKKDIGTRISIEEYNRHCRNTVMRYKAQWDKLTQMMGYWVDLEHPYITFDNDYIESVWWLLKQLYDKGLLYKGYTIQPYSPAAGTGLSSHELNLPGCYREVVDVSVVAQFEVLRDERSAFLYEMVQRGNVYLLAWTTTPWTLPSNTALAVGEDIDYALVATYNPYTLQPVNVILAEETLYRWFKPEQQKLPWVDDPKLLKDKKPHELPMRVLHVLKGFQLVGLRYKQLLPYVQPHEGKAFIVVAGDFITTDEGTGIVHIAPSFGADDMRMAKKYGLAALTLVDKEGKFVDEMGEFAGRYVKDYKNEGPNYRDVNVDIAVKLKRENKAFAVQKYRHNYPHCWRTDKPILYYPLDSWFIRTSSVKDKLVALNRQINWKPPSTGTGRFENWLANLQDWNLSRSRFWGIPLPIWHTDDYSQMRCIGSVAELKEEIEKANRVLGLNQSVPDDLHRPYIDQIVLVSDDGRPMRREEDLIDVWFDSGSMPYAQWHYPFENRDKFEQHFPADFIAEGVDQTRGWFFTLHAIAGMVFDSVAFKNVIANGLVLDRAGQKMSKRLGNVVDPFETIQTYGADATRWYMISNAPPWENLKFDIAGIQEVQRKFFGTLYNTYSFFALYANIDGFTYDHDDVPYDERPELDRWILSLLQNLIIKTHDAYANYDPTPAARAIQHFVIDHLSNWYVRLSRRRFWKGEKDAPSTDKRSAYQTLYTCLITVSKLMAPIAPFFAEWLYRNLNEVTKKEPHLSVHLTYYPQPQQQWIDTDLERRMDYAQRISSMVLSLRKKAKVRVRQPLRKILIPITRPGLDADIRQVEDIIRSEVNVKQIEYIPAQNDFIQKQIKPNYKTLGPRLGKKMKAAATQIQKLPPEVIAQLEQGLPHTIDIEGDPFELHPDDVIITAVDIPGWSVTTDGELTVALDLEIDPRLEAEGLARDIINRIQNLRKQLQLDVTEKIEVYIAAHPQIEKAIQWFGDYIANEVLAQAIHLVPEVKEGFDIELPADIQTRIRIARLVQSHQ